MVNKSLLEDGSDAAVFGLRRVTDSKVWKEPGPADTALPPYITS